MGSDSTTSHQNQEELKVSYNTDKEQEESIELYTIISGHIPEKYKYKLNSYEISDPYSELVLEYCEWEDFRNLAEYKNSIVKNSDYYRTVTRKYNLDDLKNAIKEFTSTYQYFWHIDQMNENWEKMDNPRLSEEEKKACALVLSYYTGFKDNSDRSSRNVSVLMRGLNSEEITKKWNDGEHFYPVTYCFISGIKGRPGSFFETSMGFLLIPGI